MSASFYTDLCVMKYKFDPARRKPFKKVKNRAGLADVRLPDGLDLRLTSQVGGMGRTAVARRATGRVRRPLWR
jgi:hypothetical protein